MIHQSCCIGILLAYYNQAIQHFCYKIEMSDANKKSQTLKINEEREMLTIQINELALQVIFNSPILDVCNYHEQFQKYNYRAALSRINLKVEEFDEYYSAVRERVDTFYNSLMYRSVAMIQDLLLAVRFAKIEMWREQTMITNGLRSNLYCKDIDPYNFNVQQFNSDIKAVNDIAKTNSINCKKAQETISRFLNRLKEVQSAKMEEMFSGRVINPYLATNKDGVQIDPSSMYESYLGYLLTKMERLDESIFRRHFVIHDEIIKFGQAICEHNLKYQKYASFAIKRQHLVYIGKSQIYERYNEALPNDHQTTNIAPIIKMEAKRVHFDVDQLLPGRQNRLDSKPALINKAIKVQFKETNRVLDLQTMNEQTVQHIKNEERKHYERKLHEETAAIRESPFETFAQQRRILYKDYYQHRDFQKKIREEEIRYGGKDFKEREKQRIVIRRIIRTINVPAPWLELTEYQCPFIHFLNSRCEKQDLIWDIKSKPVDKNPSPLNFFTKRERDNPILFMNIREKQQKPKVPQMQNKAQIEHKQKMERQQAFAFQDKRYAQQKVRISKSKHRMISRTYEAFMRMNKMDLVAAYASSQQVSRFGITLRTTLSMNDVASMEKFFYYYYKQRYYRQNEQVKEMADNPIIYLDSKKVNMSATPKVVGSFLSSIVKRMQTMNFFLLWTDDLICFRLKETKQKKIAEFECYNYTHTNSTDKLMYEVRRRISLQVKEIHHFYSQLQALDIVMSKVEVGHRMIFNRHRIMPAAVSSAMKGRQLAEQIFQELKQR